MSETLRNKHSVLVIELHALSGGQDSEARILYVTSTSQSPTIYFQNLGDRFDQRELPGKPVQLRLDLISNYEPSSSKPVIERRLVETRERLDAEGHIVWPQWRVYVLDVDPDHPTRIIDRGTRNHVVYVGQTSKEIETRLLEHRGERLGKRGQYLGSPRTKGRNPRINWELTPEKRVFSLQDARRFEAMYSHKLKGDGFRVLGDGLTGATKKSGIRKKKTQ